MDDTRIDVYFRGESAPGYSLAAVRQSLKTLFKTDDARIDALFSGRPVAIRRNLDANMARRYQQTLGQAGALVELRAAENAGSSSQPFAPAAPPTTAALAPTLLQPPHGSAAATGWTLTPVGADLLNPEERAPAVVAVVSRDFQIEPAGADLLRPEERRPSVVAAIDTSALGLDSTT
jgi:hypothetical protein